MELEVELRLIFALVLIFLSGFFSSAETVFFTLLGQGGLGKIEEQRPSLAFWTAQERAIILLWSVFMP